MAGMGNVSPILLKWWAQARAEEAITLPGDSWATFFGWFVATVLFAVAAAFAVVEVWKEKTPQRAFFLGLALPYLLWGAVTDVATGVRVRPARAQTEKMQLKFAQLPPLKVEVRAADNDAEVSAVTQIMTEGDSAVIATSNTGIFALPPGRYRVIVSAPGYNIDRTTIDHSEPQVVPVKLTRLTKWGQFLNGAKFAVWPHATATMSNAK